MNKMHQYLKLWGSNWLVGVGPDPAHCGQDPAGLVNSPRVRCMPECLAQWANFQHGLHLPGDPTMRTRYQPNRTHSNTDWRIWRMGWAQNWFSGKLDPAWVWGPMNRWATSRKALAQLGPVSHDTWKSCYCKYVPAHVSEFWALGHLVQSLLSSNS